MRFFYFFGGLFFLFLSKSGFDGQNQRNQLYTDGTVVEMTVNRKTFFRNVNTLKLYYSNAYYWIAINSALCDSLHLWNKIKVKYLKGFNSVLLPNEKPRDDTWANYGFLFFGIFCLVLAFNIYPKFNLWFEREKIFKSHF